MAAGEQDGLAYANWSPELRQQLARGREDRQWMAEVRLPGRDIVLFTRYLATLFEGGVPLAKALDTLCRQSEHARQAEVIWTLHDLVSQGHSLSHSFAQFPRIFSPAYVRLLEVGEKTGMLVNSLRQMAHWAERDVEVRRKVQSALQYPIFVLCLATLITLAMFLFVLPPFLDLLVGLDVPLPLPTLAMMLLVRWVGTPGFALTAVSSAALLALSWSEWRDDTRWAKFLLRVPALGSVLWAASLTRYVYAASSMVEAGCDMMVTWRLAAEASGNPYLQEDSQRLLDQVREGATLAQAMRGAPRVYGRMVIQFARGAEETAKFGPLFKHLKRIYEEKVEDSLARFTALLEPLLIGSVACFSATCMLLIFMPLYAYLGKL